MEWVTFLAQLLAPGGIAAVAVRSAMNGSRETIKHIREDTQEIRADIKELKNTASDHEKRLYHIERVKD